MDSNQELIVGRNGTIVGFGVNEQDVVSEQLKQALIGVVDPFSCIADDRGVFGTHLTSDMFCGKGQKGVSACNGDSGGGMFFEIGGKWFVRGLVSFTPLGTEQCDSLKNTAYTDVAKYLDWIKPYIDQRVLSYDSDVLNIDYVEKLRLFNFQTCGIKSSSYVKNAGAPLQEMKMLNGTERYFLRGVELHGLVCDLQAPAIYFDAEAYLDWILYNMRENVLDTMDVFETVTTNQTLEVEWSKLQQQPGKEPLHLFNMDTCGLATDGLEIYKESTALPWNGIIMNDANFTGEVPSTRSMVVLISEWYALAPRRSIENDVAWRYIMLGVQLNDCITSQCKTHQVVEIRNIILPPPNHPRQTFALIELLEPANLMNPYIRPICLPLMDQLHHHNPTEVGISINLGVVTVNKKLAVIDNPSCKHGLRQESYFIDFNEDSRQCAIEMAIEYKQMPVPSVLGSPLMMPVRYGESTHYFLYGMDNNVPGEYNRSIFGPYLFDTVQSADLEWVVENVREHERPASLPSTLTNGRVNLKPVQQASKSSLFNFNTCGKSSSNFPMPWVGKRLSNAPFFNESSCLVTLISDWYVVGPADCFEEIVKSTF
uniref:Peptidase S1 domain-containing protein n=1 Tax=Anopheles coluzzii TaxID=1518534 RepID=A0A8W7PIN2_ANOCL